MPMIHDNAKLGDKFLTTENKLAVFLRFAENAEHKFAIFYVEGWGTVQVYRENGREVHGECAYDIIGEYEEKEPRGKEMSKIGKIRQEIEARIKSCKTKNGFPAGTNSAIRIEVYEKLLSFIDSLQQEQPEVDLEEEIAIYLRTFSSSFGNGIEYAKNIARHFYELGLNARKEE